MRFDGKIVVVTGGESGIGLAAAQSLAQKGAKVITADLSATVTALDPQATIAAFKTDVADPNAVQGLVDAVMRAHGRIDCLIQSAGIGLDVPLVDTTPEQFDRIITVNLKGMFLVGQAVARIMVAQGSGAIVNIASVSGLRGNVGRAAYGASKGGVVTMSEVMAVELAQAGVRVNIVAPGPVETPLVAQLHDQEIRQSWYDTVPMRRYGTPDEIANAAIFLCSDEASYINGHTLVVDGGFMAAGIQRQTGHGARG